MLFVLTPGADWAYAISSGLRLRNVAPAVSGLLSDHLLATVAVAARVAALLAGSPTVLAVLTVAGAGYLVWLGTGMLRHLASVQAQPEEAAGSAWRQAIKGFGISGLNPKVFLLFLALLPQFVVATATWPVATQIMVLGLVPSPTAPPSTPASESAPVVCCAPVHLQPAGPAASPVWR